MHELEQLLGLFVAALTRRGVFRDPKDVKPSGRCAVGRSLQRVVPAYQLLIESYSKAQEVVTQREQPDSVLV
jgi:hypothetical protein